MDIVVIVIIIFALGMGLSQSSTEQSPDLTPRETRERNVAETPEADVSLCDRYQLEPIVRDLSVPDHPAEAPHEP